MAKLKTTPKSNTSSRIKDLNKLKILGFVGVLLFGFIAWGISMQFRPGKQQDGFAASVAARLSIGDVTALGDAVTNYLTDDTTSDAAKAVEVAKVDGNQPAVEGKPKEPGLIKKGKDFLGLSDYNLSTGAHPHKEYPDLVYVGDSTENTRLLSAKHPILGKEYDSRGCLSDEKGDVKSGDIVCSLPVGNLELPDFREYCVKTYGEGARPPYELEYSIVTNSKHFKNYDLFAIWLLDVDPHDDDNFKVALQNSGLDLGEYLDEDSDPDMLTTFCVKPIESKKE